MIMRSLIALSKPGKLCPKCLSIGWGRRRSILKRGRRNGRYAVVCPKCNFTVITMTIAFNPKVHKDVVAFLKMMDGLERRARKVRILANAPRYARRQGG